MDIYGYPWIIHPWNIFQNPRVIHGFLLIIREYLLMIHDCQWIMLDIHALSMDYSWIPMVHGHPWVIHLCPWIIQRAQRENIGRSVSLQFGGVLRSIERSSQGDNRRFGVNLWYFFVDWTSVCEQPSWTILQYSLLFKHLRISVLYYGLRPLPPAPDHCSLL